MICETRRRHLPERVASAAARLKPLLRQQFETAAPTKPLQVPSVQWQGEDQLRCVSRCRNRDTILLATSSGKALQVAVSDLTPQSRNGGGVKVRPAAPARPRAFVKRSQRCFVPNDCASRVAQPPHSPTTLPLA